MQPVKPSTSGQVSSEQKQPPSIQYFINIKSKDCKKPVKKAKKEELVKVREV
jgi:hypothetical protein